MFGGHGLRGAGAALALLSLSACLDLDTLQERATDAGAGSDGERDGAVPAGCDLHDVRALRFWKLHLGQHDYVTLKNPTECPIELNGVQLFFDDVSELFTDDPDCHVQLPEFRLEPGAEVRLHEAPLAGDIGVLDNNLTPCPFDFSFNPMRGGVSYLCDGECDSDTVIDVVAFAGDEAATPPALFGQRFDQPLTGVTQVLQESTQYRRSALQGEAPEFLASDWTLETRFVHASFESGVEAEVDGATTAFVPEEGESATFSTSEIAGEGDVALALTHRGDDGRSDGLALELEDPGTPIGSISYFARIDTPGASGAFFDLQAGGAGVVQASFAPSGLGTQLDDERVEVDAAAGAFHQVEFRNIDWPARHYDLYIDRILVALDLPFQTDAEAPDRLSLYGMTADTISHWDEIELWRDAP